MQYIEMLSIYILSGSVITYMLIKYIQYSERTPEKDEFDIED